MSLPSDLLLKDDKDDAWKGLYIEVPPWAVRIKHATAHCGQRLCEPLCFYVKREKTQKIKQK